MNNTTSFSLVKLSVTTKRLVALALLIGIVVIVLFAVFFLARKKSLLIDYLPRDTAFWFWQRGGGYDARAADALLLLGLDPKIRPILEGRKEDIVIYMKDGEWYRLEEKELNGEPDDTRPNLRRTLTADPAATIVGIVHGEYLQGRFPSIFSSLSTRESHRFVLKPSIQTLAFRVDSMSDTAATAARRTETRALPLPSFPASVILAFRAPDKDVQKRGAAYLQERIREAVAFRNPVIAQKTLPDGTIAKERVADPALFTWVSRESHVFELAVDEDAAAENQVVGQLRSFTTPFFMYMDDTMVVVGTSKQDVAERDVSSPSTTGFFYINRGSFSEAEFGDILGKSEALLWLQKIGVKRILFMETQTYAEGELTF